MRVLAKVLLVLVMCVAVLGCGKKSGLEGKVVDGKGKPIANVKVIAKQHEPIKGYEQFETTTGSDGVFKFKGLYPNSTYRITCAQDLVRNNGSWETGGPLGETKRMKEPLVVRFIKISESIIADSITGLQCMPSNGSGMTWAEAVNYASNINVGGGGWRIPTKREVDLLRGSMGSNEATALNMEGYFVWYGKEKDWHILDYDSMTSLSGGRDVNHRVILVRSPK